MDDNTAHDGRVEVRTNNGQWNTICNKYWDLREAYVVNLVPRAVISYCACSTKELGSGKVQ